MLDTQLLLKNLTVVPHILNTVNKQILPIVVVGFGNGEHTLAPNGSYSSPYMAVRSSFACMLDKYSHHASQYKRVQSMPVRMPSMHCRNCTHYERLRTQKHRSNTSNAEPTVTVFIHDYSSYCAAKCADSHHLRQLRTAERYAHTQLATAEQLILSSYSKLSDNGRERVNLYLKHNPYLQVLTPTVVPQETDTEEWDDKIKGVEAGVTAAVKADIASMQSSSSNISKQPCTAQADVAAIQADMKSARAEAAAPQSSVDKTH
eukprot:13630-Heterococcus_DN1.PRE.6